MADINCYGVLKAGFADDLRRAVLRVPKHEPLELHISSPGGLLSEGVTAYNVLRKAPNEVIAYLDGDAFSAATLLLCAADSVDMPSNSLLMIHEPWVPNVSPGSIDELTKCLRYLKMTRQQVVDIYHERTGIGQEELAQMMTDETYFTAVEAHARGFATNVTVASPSVQNLAEEQYMVRDPQRLASMLLRRHVVRDVQSLLDSIGVVRDDD